MKPSVPPARFAAALSTSDDTAGAVRDTAAQVLQGLGGPPDLALAFVSLAHGDALESLPAWLCEALQTETLLGCTGESIVGGGREIEDGPALSLWAARLPGASILPMHLEFARTPEGGTLVGWPDALPAEWPAGSTLLALGEPFSFPAEMLLERVNDEHPGVRVVGGMASGGQQPGANRVFLGRQSHQAGAACALIGGEVRVRTVVSQGCRPIGRHFVVTKSQRNVILELGGQPPLARLQELLGSLTQREKQQLQRGLHVGRAINEYQDTFGRGDFLVSNVIGADPETGAIAVGNYVKTGQTVQFHVRDAASADEDLRELLAAAHGQGPAAGALLFTCNGRGTRMFPEPDHDAGVVQAVLGTLPLAGFFAQGELGPIGGLNFIHGFTASVVLFGQ
jgi:small ligand-binding sensory domain FIST